MRRYCVVLGRGRGLGWRLFLIGKHSALQNHKAVTHYQVVNTDTINID